MQSDPEGGQQPGRFIVGPQQLPPLVKGQKLQSGPYIVTVTDEMVAERERQNEALYRAWLQEQRRRAMRDGGDGGDEDSYTEEFKYVDVRRTFVRKVFCILSLQLLFATGVIAFFMFVEEATKFMILYWHMWIVAMGVFMVTYCAISCSECARRQVPNNYICLFLLTLSMAYLAAFVSVYYTVEMVLMAIGMTTIVTLGISLVATFSKFDLTMRSGLVMVFSLVAMISIVVIIVILMFTYIRILHLAIAVIATFMLSMYLYFDIQTIMGGRRVELSPDEVVYAATQVFVDIILLYQYILMFMGFAHQ